MKAITRSPPAGGRLWRCSGRPDGAALGPALMATSAVCNAPRDGRGVHERPPSPVSPHLAGQLGALAALAADAQHPVLLGSQRAAKR